MMFQFTRALRGLTPAGVLAAALALPAPAPLPSGAVWAAPAASPAPAVIKTYVVTSTADTSGNCTDPGSTTCTLRQALQDSNNNPPGTGNTNLITFSIGTGLQTIAVTADLRVEQPVVIDGTTQPGGGTTPRIQLQRSSGSGDGLLIFAPNVTVKGLALNRLATAIGIAAPSNGLPNSGGVVIQGNYIGVDPTGTAAAANSGFGISVRGVPNVTIGGTAAGAGNVISGNEDGGIVLSAFSPGHATGTVIQGNLIGTNAAGNAAIPNGQSGIAIEDEGIIVGGTQAGAGNVISGNAGDGIVFVPGFGVGPLTGAVIQGNFIGTDRTGTLQLGNTGNGINTQGSGHDNTIGGTASGAGNTVAFNTGAGIAIGLTASDNGAVGNAVLGNTIYGNQGGGIVLASQLSIPNDPQDPDLGPNRRQNYPIITTASTGAGGTTVTGTLNSNPNQPFRLEFFASPAPGSGTLAQGQQLLGFVNVTTDASGNASFTFTTPTTLPTGRVVTATATNTQLNDTSGFSPLLAVTGGSSVTPTSTIAPTLTATPVVPELPPLALFGSGLLLLVGFARWALPRGARGQDAQDKRARGKSERG